ncbi:hypothetical protein OQA88_7725 [Cercophora sp. LCS_1]
MSAPQPAEPTVPTLPWHAAYPAPRKAKPLDVEREEVLALLKAQREDQYISGTRGFLLVDLRRVDYEGGTIRGSINLPAQSLYPTIPTLYSILKAASVQKVIWYCSSSRGRGPRAAGWFSDYLSDQGDSDMQSLVLVDGIKGWATAGPEYTEWMDEYDEALSLLRRELDGIKDILARSVECDVMEMSEAAWNTDVHMSLLHLALRGYPAVEAYNITTAPPCRELLPPNVTGDESKAKLVDLSINVRPLAM